MQPIQKTLKLNKEKYYETHLAIINSLLPIKMTDMEIKVIARFMSFRGDIAAQRFGASAKKIVKEQLDLSSAGLSNYMRSLTEKGFLIKKADDIVILPILIPAQEEQVYMFKLINFGDDRGNG